MRGGVGLNQELKTKIYRHSSYKAFYVQDPKLRLIHKACVKDRVLHHAVFRKLYLIFDKSFIFDSYSCRLNKGTHSAVNRLNKFANKTSKNNKTDCFVLKCDIKKFFDSVNQYILINLIKNKIQDKNTIWLINKIIKSFKSGLPLGNITSQLFANIYLNKLDQFIKHNLKIKYYIRYCDDFVIISQDRNYLINLILQINNFLINNLKLLLHRDKIIIRKYHQGIDFLGYVSFPNHRVLRTKTKNRIFKKIKQKIKNKTLNNQVLQSYLGMLRHCDGFRLESKLRSILQ